MAPREHTAAFVGPPDEYIDSYVILITAVCFCLISTVFHSSFSVLL